MKAFFMFCDENRTISKLVLTLSLLENVAIDMWALYV